MSIIDRSSAKREALDTPRPVTTIKSLSFSAICVISGALVAQTAVTLGYIVEGYDTSDSFSGLAIALGGIVGGALSSQKKS